MSRIKKILHWKHIEEVIKKAREPSEVAKEKIEKVERFVDSLNGQGDDWFLCLIKSKDAGRKIEDVCEMDHLLIKGEKT